MSFFSFHGKRSGSKKSVGGKTTFVPRLEVLESRELLATFVVTNTSSDVNTSGSLPWAVQQSNGTPGQNTINFNIPGSGVQIINLNSVEYISNPVVINGTSQPGYNGTPLISVQGNSSVPVLFFVTAGSAGSTIEGLDMYNFTGNAITLIDGSSGDWIQNNWIGFYLDPTTGQVSLNSALGYSDTGAIGIQSSNNTIRNNVMSGVYNAVSIGEDPSQTWSGTVYSGNSIADNFFGTNPSGTTAQNYGNQSDAIFLGSGSQGNFLGPSNVMSGGLHGIEFYAPTATGNIVFQNYIGTDVTGNYAIPNVDGIDIGDGAYGNTIGGAFGGNVISGNSGVGINLGVPGYGLGNNNWVQGNIIGLNASQTAAIGAGNYGVSINSGSSGNIVQGNVIAGATLAGVLLQQASANNVSGNWIGESSSGVGFANGQLGVSVVQESDYNTILGNIFGLNGAGTIYIDPTSVGNNIGSASSASNLVAQLVQEVVSFEQNLLNDILPTLSQLLQNIATEEQQIVQDILNALSHI